MNLKRKISILSFAAILPLIGYSQECHWKEYRKDPISDMKYIKSKNVTLFGDQKYGKTDKSNIDAHIELQDGSVRIYILLQRMGLMSDEKIADAKLLLKLKNGKIIELTTEEKFPTKVNIQYTEVYFRWLLATDQIQMLAESEPVAMRLSMNGQDFLYELSDKKANSFFEYCKCMSSEMPAKN